MYLYVTLFSVGKGTEALLVDSFTDQWGDFVEWDSREQYFSARGDEPEVIDGGVYAYWLVAATWQLPESIHKNRIVSFSAAGSVLGLLRVLHSVVRAMRAADWPEYPEE